MQDKYRWYDIPGFEGLYQIDEEGNVRTIQSSYYSKNALISDNGILQYKNMGGNRRKNPIKGVTLFKNGKEFTRSVGQLMANVFLKNPKNMKIVTYRDGNPGNLHLSNLRWKTPQK